MGGNADFDLVGDSQTAAPLKLLFGHKHLDVPLQFPAILLRQLMIERAAGLNNPLPVRGKRVGP